MSLEIDPEAVPDELKERDQWLLWSYESTPEKRPLNAGGGGASWNDPSEWLSFEHALQLAEEDPYFDGIGFVISEGDPFLGIDIDGCLRERFAAKPKDWLPNLEGAGLKETYIEYSVSGSGLHPFVRERSVPAWWTDTQVGEHEGVEVYEEKFFIVTGEPIDLAADQISDVNPEPFLTAATASIEGELPDDHPAKETAASSDSDDDSDDTPGSGDAEAIAKAIDNLDARQVAGKTIVDRWTENVSGKRDNSSDGNRAFIPTWAGSDCEGTANIVNRDIWVDTGADAKGGPQVMAAIDMGEIEHDDASPGVEGSLWWDTAEYLRDELGFNIPEPEDSQADDGGTVEADSRPAKDATADGGAVAEAAESETGQPEQSDEQPDPQPGRLTPGDIMLAAGLDPDEDSIKDLDDRELAHYTAFQLFENDEHHFLATTPDQLLWYCEDGVWRQKGEQKLRELAKHALGSQYGANVLEELKEQIRSMRAVPRHAMGTPTGKVPVENGLLDLDKAAAGEPDALRDLEPDDRAMVRIPTEYDPDAECPRWPQFLEESVPEKWHDALQEFAGYTLCVDEFPLHRALMLVGDGSNGKGVFLNTIRSVLDGDEDDRGRKNVVSKSLHALKQNNPSEARAALFGKIANIDNELSRHALGDGGFFKKLTGGDQISAREPYATESYDFVVTAKQMYATNRVPEIDVDDDAFFRRWLIIEFPNKFTPSDQPGPDRDPDLEAKLTTPEAKSAILNWMIEGRARLLEQDSFTNEGRIMDKRDRWLQYGDSITQFIEEGIEVTGDNDDRVSTTELGERYSAYCRQVLDEDPEAQQTVTKEVKGLEGVTYKKNSRIDGRQVGRALWGIRFSDEVPDPGDGSDDGSSQAGLNMTQDSRIRKIRNWIDEFSTPVNGADREALTDYAEDHGVDREVVEETIDKLLREGEAVDSGDGLRLT